MALSPKQMGEAVTRNLKAKTGKTVEEWIAIVQHQNLHEKKEVLAFLKNEKGLGHFQAVKVYDHLNGIDEYKDPKALIEDIFNTPALMKKYKTIEKTIKSFGKDVTVKPCKTYTPFYRHNQFAMVTVDKKKNISIGLNLPEDFEHSKFAKAKTKGSKRINFQTTLQVNENIDQTIINAILVAYKNN